MENLTLIIPAKFEATTLPLVLKEIDELNLKCKKIVVVPKYDKETQKVLEKSDCKIIIQNGEGFGNALIQGLNHSTTEYSCIFNADGSFDPKYLGEMLKKNENNHLSYYIELEPDLIICAPQIIIDGSPTKLGSDIFNCEINQVVISNLYLVGAFLKYRCYLVIA